eukprot:TRINITY_DN1403_c0_g1_i8.p2 TRINITY_DN1403_c0_g1~~TRINITY_DN1403_c0_g1_i8.p2  ORF type:complete len:108 (-),score=29.33 TRINITY_DN1403_c0_g1_i8:5-328(-)
MTHSWIFVLSLSVLYTLFLYFYIAALPLTAYSLFFLYFFFFLMIRRPPRSTHCISSAASDVYKRQAQYLVNQKLATIEKIFTKTEELDNNRKALKLIIKLKRIPESK